MKSLLNKKELAALIAIILVVCAMFGYVASQKVYLHMDEVLSLGFSNYDIQNIEMNDDFFHKWHDSAYYEDYLVVNGDEKGELAPVYNNQKDNVHPPFYYLVLRLAMSLSGEKFSLMPGIVLNILIEIPLIVFLYLIAKKMFENILLALGSTLLASVSLCTVSSVMFIRMYALTGLFVVMTLWFHIRIDEKRESIPLCIAIAVTALLGSLTHYYYLFFFIPLFAVACFRFIKSKQGKALRNYLIAVFSAAALSLIIFPYSIKHLFTTYRGKGALWNLRYSEPYTKNIGLFTDKAYTYIFNCMLFAVVGFSICMLIFIAFRHKKLEITNAGTLITAVVPTLFYFIVVSVASPYVELRYIMPVSQLFFVITIAIMWILMRQFMTRSGICVVFAILFIGFVRLPIKREILPEMLFTERLEIVETIENAHDRPAIYCLNSEHDRFLEDIYLFTKIDDSYIACDADYSKESIQSIFKDTDTSRGITVFINEGFNNDDTLWAIRDALDLGDIEYIGGLNAGNVYCINAK